MNFPLFPPYFSPLFSPLLGGTSRTGLRTTCLRTICLRGGLAALVSPETNEKHPCARTSPWEKSKKRVWLEAQAGQEIAEERNRSAGRSAKP